MIANCKGCRFDTPSKPCAVKAKLARGGVPPNLVRTGESIFNIETGRQEPVVTCLEWSKPKAATPKAIALSSPVPGQLEMFS